MKNNSDSTLQINRREMAYDRISDDWESFISHYDENRRIEVLIDNFLGEKEIAGKKCLDAGCGLGYFSQTLLKYKPAALHACDLSPKLVNKLSEKIPAIHCFVANILELSSTVKGEQFDVVVCSEVIEHTNDPFLATKELIKTVAPGGLLALSVPNQKWRWLLTLAQWAKIRTKYEGYENWVRPSDLKIWLEQNDMELLRCEGVHTIPFKLFPKSLLRPLDQRLKNSNYSYSLNLAVLARKKTA